MIRLFLVVFWACLCQFAIGQQIHVYFEPLENYDDYNEANLKIGQSLSEALKLRLFFEDDIHMCSEEDEQRDFTVYGYYENFDGEILLELAIDDMAHYESFFLDPVSVHRANIYSAIDGLVDEILGNLHEHAKIASQKTVAILCYSAAPGTDVAPEFLTDLEFMSFFELPVSLSPIHYGDVEEFCDEPDLNEIALALADYGIDAVLRAEVSTDNGDLYVSPTLHIPSAGGGQSITPLAFVSSVGEPEFDFGSFGQYLRSAFGSAVLPNGDWDFTQYAANTSQNVDEIYAALKNEFEQDEPDLYLAYVLTQEALELAPERAESHHNLGLYQFLIGEYYYAADAFSQALDINPLLAESYIMLGSIHEWTEDYDQATEVYQIAYNSLEDPQFLVPLGRSYFFVDSLEQCIRWMKMAESHYQGDEETLREINSYIGVSYSSMGQELYRESKFEEAIEYCTQASHYVYDDFNEFQIIMWSHNRLGNYKTSLELVDQRVISGDDLQPDFLIQYAQDLRSLKNTDGSFVVPALEASITALNRYVKRIEEKGEKPIARCYQRLGSTYFRLGRLNDAIESYKLALELDPNYLGHYLNLAEAAIMDDQFELAASTMEQTTRFQFDSPRLIGNEALIYFLEFVAVGFQGGDTSEAKRKLDAVLTGKEYFYIEWSFKTFNTWLEGKDFDAALVAEIVAYTVEMDKF